LAQYYAKVLAYYDRYLQRCKPEEYRSTTEASIVQRESMRGSVIEDEGNCLHLATQGLGNDVVLHKGLEIDKAFALPAGSVDLPISNGKSSKQMACAATVIPRFMQHRFA